MERTTAVASTELGMAGAVQGSEANIGSGAFDGHLCAAAAPADSFSGAHHNSTGFARQVRATAGRGVVVPVTAFHLYHEPGSGVAYPNIRDGEFWRQRGPVGVVLLRPRRADGVVQEVDNYGYSALQPCPRAGHVAVPAALLPGGIGAVYGWDYALQPRPGAGRGEVPGLGGLLPVADDAGLGEVFVALPGGVDAVHANYRYNALQARSGGEHGEVLVDLLTVPDGAGQGEEFVGLLLGGVDAVYDEYDSSADYPGAGRGEELLGPLPDGVVVVFDSSGDSAQQTLLGTGRADGIGGALRDPILGAGHDGTAGQAEDFGAVYYSRGMVAEHLRRLFPFAGIGVCSVAVNGLAAGPGSPAAAFHLFALLLGGLFLIILHVLRV